MTNDADSPSCVEMVVLTATVQLFVCIRVDYATLLDGLAKVVTMEDLTLEFWIVPLAGF